MQLVSACPVGFAHRTQQWLEPAADVERRQLDAAAAADQAVLFMHWLQFAWVACSQVIRWSLLVHCRCGRYTTSMTAAPSLRHLPAARWHARD